MTMIRLQKFLSGAGVASRRAAERLIDVGAVAVNGELAHIGQSVDPATDVVTVNGKVIKPAAEIISVMLHKPVGYVTTRASFANEKSVYELLPAKWRTTIWPIGRLDKDSCGLLLFTNDGELTQKLTHPRYQNEKEYLVRFTGTLPADAKAQLQRGIQLDDGKTAPCKIAVVNNQEIKIILREGKKRQIRRMLATVGCRVTFLQRVRDGVVVLGTLPVGKYRQY